MTERREGADVPAGAPDATEPQGPHDADAGDGGGRLDDGRRDPVAQASDAVHSAPSRTTHSGAGIAGRGAAMGLADVIPGVSGGTMALVLGIYPRFVRALHHIDLDLVRKLWHGAVGGSDGRRALAQHWRQADLGFLAILAVGILAGVLVGAKVLVHLFEAYPVPSSAALFGLILVSAWVPWRMVRRRDAWSVGLLLVTAVAAFWLTGLEPRQAPEATWFWPIAGAIAICAMVLPGISGAFLLVLMGLYLPLLGALEALELGPVALFAAGAAVGLLAFVRLLDRLLTRAPSPTLAALTGLMLGALGRVWPFKSGGHLGEGVNVAPPGVEAAMVALAAAVAGALLGWALTRMEKPSDASA